MHIPGSNVIILISITTKCKTCAREELTCVQRIKHKWEMNVREKVQLSLASAH